MLYKLTDRNGYTRAGHANACLWGVGVTHRAQAKHGGLCSGQYIHAYVDPFLAVLLNPIHSDIARPRLWEAKGRIAARDGQLKVGCRSLTTVREIALPVVTTEHRVRFAILCAKSVYSDAKWNAWADRWLSGEDRSTIAGSVEIDLVAVAHQACEVTP